DDDYESRHGNAPMEWDGRRYGRDFNDDPNDGGRGIYEGGGRYGQRPSDQGGSSGNFGERGSYGRDAGDSNYYRMSQQGRPRERQGFGYSRGGYSGNDYGSDYDYSAPYADSYGNSVTGSNWSRTRGSGSWNAGDWNSGEMQQPYRSSNDLTGYQEGGYRQSGYQQGGARSAQSYRGRGPKGFARTDERLKEIVCERLTDAPHIDASEIS